MEKKKKLQIHNSTMEFLIFQLESKEEGIEVLYKDDTLWLLKMPLPSFLTRVAQP